jgi:hypothetical protein
MVPAVLQVGVDSCLPCPPAGNSCRSCVELLQAAFLLLAAFLLVLVLVLVVVVVVVVLVLLTLRRHGTAALLELGCSGQEALHSCLEARMRQCAAAQPELLLPPTLAPGRLLVLPIADIARLLGVGGQLLHSCLGQGMQLLQQRQAVLAHSSAGVTQVQCTSGPCVLGCCLLLAPLHVPLLLLLLLLLLAVVRPEPVPLPPHQVILQKRNRPKEAPCSVRRAPSRQLQLWLQPGAALPRLQRPPTLCQPSFSSSTLTYRLLTCSQQAAAARSSGGAGAGRGSACRADAARRTRRRAAGRERGRPRGGRRATARRPPGRSACPPRACPCPPESGR